MRELKFRAWDGKRMIPSVTPFQWDFLIATNHWKCVRHDTGGHPVFEVEGVPFTNIMQFTGLKDKNGKEIYEGDIVKACGEGGEDPIPYEVEYCGDRNYPAFDLKEFPCVDSNSMSYCLAVGSLEVIGNIYENPELLTK